MDFDSLKNQVANISLYDIKAGFRKAQNAVMNYTEMEAKVREATNNEPWGCPTSTMQEIANGTFNYGTLNEIMPMIYKRFTEKTAEEWRQIYKSLQLLEFLIKNGSERVIDDARSHLSLLKMLRQFHYIDSNGKDQGINVRNRAKELAELLGDVDRIRAERKKARATRNKYGGVEGGAGLGGSSSASRFGGFGSETGGSSTYGGYSGGVYGDGGGFGGQSDDYDETQASSRKERFEEYDEYDEGTAATPGRRKVNQPVTSKPQPPKPKEPEVDLFDFGDNDLTSAVPAPTASDKKITSAGNDFNGFQAATGADDDEFDDFQSATQQSTTSPNTTQFAAPRPLNGPASSAGMNNILSTMSPPPQSTGTPSMMSSGGTSTIGGNYSAFNIPTPSSTAVMSPPPQQGVSALQPQQMRSSGFQAATPNYFGSISANNPSNSTSMTPLASGQTQSSGFGSGTTSAAAVKKPASGVDPFASLVIGGASAKKTGAAGAGKGPTMADMAKQRASAGIWGAGGNSSGTPKASGGGNGGGDLLG